MTRNRIPHSITLPKDLDQWVVNKIMSKEFANFTHAVERALVLLKEKIGD